MLMVTGSAEAHQLLALMEPVAVAAALGSFPSVANKHLLSVCQYKCLSVCLSLMSGWSAGVFTGSRVRSLPTADCVPLMSPNPRLGVFRTDTWQGTSVAQKWPETHTHTSSLSGRRHSFSVWWGFKCGLCPVERVTVSHSLWTLTKLH